MVSSGCKFGLFPSFFCLISGLTVGFLYLCSDWESDLREAPETSVPDELHLRTQWTLGGTTELEQRRVAETAAQVVNASRQQALVTEPKPAQLRVEVQSGSNPHEDKSSLAQEVRQALAEQQSTQQSELRAAEEEEVDIIEDGLGGESDVADGQDQSPEDTEKRKQERQEAEKGKLTKAEIRAIVAETEAQKKAAGMGDVKAGALPLSRSVVQAIVDAHAKGGKKVVGADGEVKGVKHTVSIAQMAQMAAQTAQQAQHELDQQGLTGLSARDQKFMFQMTDMLAMGNQPMDLGGESIKMKTLTEDEANAQDALEYNSKTAYGAREEDLVIFLQVQQGMPKMEENVHKSMLRAAAEGVPMLTIDLVRKQAKDNLVFVTCAGWGYYDFALNWVANLRKAGITNYLVGALDRQTSLGLSTLGIPGFQMFPGGEGAAALATQEFRPAQENFHRISRQKVALARLFTDFGYDVIVNDVDTVWLQDPTAFIRGIQDADILTATDDLSSTLQPGDDGLEMVQAIQGTLSMSVLYLRHSPLVKQFVEAWDRLLAGHLGRVDQIAFNTLIAEYTNPLRAVSTNARVATGPEQKIAVGVLPAARFMNGHTFFVQKLHQVYGQKPFSVHVNFNEGGVRGKRHRLREAGLWIDPPSYFEGSSGFIQVLIERPPEPYKDLSDAEMLRFHVESLQKQLQQVRAGVALAVALERTLILPKLTCFCDRSWVGLKRCRAPAAETMQLPFDCPLDYVMEPSQLDDAGREHGPRIDFREYNFLDRSHRPSVLKESMVAVVPSGRSIGQYLGSGLPTGVSSLYVEPLTPDDGLRAQLADHASVRILTFIDAAKTFGGFRDADWARVVAKRVARLGGVWCCGEGDQQSLTYHANASLVSLTAA